MKLTCCTLVDFKRLLVMKSQVHRPECAFLGMKGLFDCCSPVRLASGTVSLLIKRLVNMFEGLG